MSRHDYVAIREDSLLLIIDVQQAMRKVMDSWETVAGKLRQLVQAADALGVPVLVTEQYKKGLGPTDPALLRAINAPTVVQKEHFSACMEPAFLSAVRSYQRHKIVVAGMETHVCVLQTCLDLIASGFQVHLAADAVASRVDQNRDIAVDLLRQAGAVVSSAEIVIFQWACRANTADFRRILPIVK
jgi:nicotinamidase-related amidase